MKSDTAAGWRKWRTGLALGLACFWLASPTEAQTVVFGTGFEAEEGYQNDADLTGQLGWLGDGADGVLTNFFEGLGQQAYIGYTIPSGDTNATFSVYRPVNFAPLAANRALVRFSVRMQIVDSSSTNGPFDDFRWSVYNTNSTRLFSLDFDNDTWLVSYLLDDGSGFISTEKGFDTKGYYDLLIEMNFARNLWTAWLNDEVLVDGAPISAAGNPLHLGDIAAVWILREPSFPGDNYMLFDEYWITAESAPAAAPELEFLRISNGGSFQARVYGEPGLAYRIEASTDLQAWEHLMTFTLPSGGILDFQDPDAVRYPRRFYRVRQGGAF